MPFLPAFSTAFFFFFLINTSHGNFQTWRRASPRDGKGMEWFKMALRRNSLPHSLTSPGRDTLIENSSVSESRLYSRQKTECEILVFHSPLLGSPLCGVLILNRLQRDKRINSRRRMKFFFPSLSRLTDWRPLVPPSSPTIFNSCLLIPSSTPLIHNPRWNFMERINYVSALQPS